MVYVRCVCGEHAVTAAVGAGVEARQGARGGGRQVQHVLPLTLPLRLREDQTRLTTQSRRSELYTIMNLHKIQLRKICIT